MSRRGLPAGSVLVGDHCDVRLSRVRAEDIADLAEDRQLVVEAM
jgi:hypothetical protein